MSGSQVQDLLQHAVAQRIGSGMAASFGKLDDLIAEKPVHDFYVGKTSHLAEADLVGTESDFDLASLTKILATTLLAMVKVEEGVLNLDSTLGQVLVRECQKNPSLSPLTIRSLLSHSSGLPAWKPFHEALQLMLGDRLPWIDRAERKRKFDALLYQIPPERALGEKVVYSDLGFLILERVLAPDFENEVTQVWKRISGMKLHFRPVISDAKSERWRIQQSKQSVVMTELCPWRGLIQGQVHDDNCWSRGGVAGHAGAFGRLEDVKLWIKAVFSLAIVNSTTLREFTREVSAPLGAARALGFDLPARDGSGSTGFSFSKNSVGHLGFTGTSLWVDLDAGIYAVLLTNRVHPDRNDTRIRVLRREFHKLVQGELQNEKSTD